MKLQFGDINGDGNKNPTYTIVVSHGASSGSMTGGAVNKNERFAAHIDNMDMFITAHTHRPLVTNPGKIFIDARNNKVSVKPFKVVTATSWLNAGGYSLQKLLTPTSHVAQTITLRGNRKEMVVSM